MEQKDKRIVRFHHDRSTTACIADGWRIFSLNWRAYLRFQWPYLLLAALGTALFGFLLMRLVADILLPVVLLRREGVPFEVLQMVYRPAPRFVAMLAVGALCGLVGLGYWKGCLYTQMRVYAATDALPAMKALFLRKDVRRVALRAIAAECVVALSLLLAGAALLCAAWAWSGWLLLIALPVLVYVWVASLLLELRFLLEGRSMGRSLALAAGHDVRRFGGYFVLALLSWLPAIALTCVASLPACVLQCAWLTDAVGVLKGDASGLPAYFSVLYVPMGVLQGFVACFAFGLQRWALALKPLPQAEARKPVPEA